MKKDPKSFASGDLVFAKVRGYPAWPARVTCPADKNCTKFHVFFYGTYETAICKSEELWIYDAGTKAKYGRQKRKFFAEALDEIENRPDIAIAAPIAEPSATDEGLPANPDDTSIVDETGPTASTSNTPLTPRDDDLSSEEHALVIDESSKGSNKNSKNRGSKRKADESPATPLQPPIKQIRIKLSSVGESTATPPAADSTVMTPTTTPTLSKSGRIIKPKKFVDESPDNSPAQGNDHGEFKIKKKDEPLRRETSHNVAPREIFVHVKQTGDIIKVDLEKDRPEKFSSGEEESNWESSTARNAASFKEKVESGKIVPTEIRKKLEQTENRTVEEHSMLEKEKFVANRLEKIRWLKIEQKLVDMDIDLKKALNFKQPNMELSLKVLRDLQRLYVCAYMFKKQPAIVQTIRMLQKYCGPATPSPDPKVNASWESHSEAIRNEATKVYSKIRSLFVLAPGKTFLETFNSEVEAYREAAKNIPVEKLLLLVKDPTKSGNY